MILASYKNPWGVDKFIVYRINKKTFTLKSKDPKFRFFKSVKVPIHKCTLSFEEFVGERSKAMELLNDMPFHIRIQAAPFYLKEADLLYYLRDQAEEVTKQFNFEIHMIEAAVSEAMEMISEETMEETGYHTMESVVCDIDPTP